MKVDVRAANSEICLSQTSVVNMLDDQLIVFVRPWGSSDYNQKFIDEISHYLSSSQADLEVTTPFDYLETLSSAANKSRIALLLAHDLFYKTENKAELVVGFEAMILFRVKSEIAWSSVGRFTIEKFSTSGRNLLFSCGTDLDCEVLLPTALIGADSNVEIQSGSFKLLKDEQIFISSCYNSFPQVSRTETGILEVEVTSGSYWSATLTDN